MPLIVKTSTPATISREARVCRREWIVTSGRRSPNALTKEWSIAMRGMGIKGELPHLLDEGTYVFGRGGVFFFVENA